MNETNLAQRLFSLRDRVAVITGGAGLLGARHAEIIASAGGIPILVDIDRSRAEERAAEIAENYRVPALGVQTDITEPESVRALLERILSSYRRLDILINNAA